MLGLEPLICTKGSNTTMLVVGTNKMTPGRDMSLIARLVFGNFIWFKFYILSISKNEVPNISLVIGLCLA